MIWQRERLLAVLISAADGGATATRTATTMTQLAATVTERNGDWKW